MSNDRPPFKPGSVYHVYSHGNAEDNIFREEKNYPYFLKGYIRYVYPIAKTYAFCLLPNHFHFLVEMRSAKALTGFFRKKDKDLIGFEDLSDLVSKQFSHFLNAYAKAFNKMYSRKGKLFQKSLNRKEVKNRRYYTKLITYIHQNPVRHGFVNKSDDWPFSSYPIILSQNQTKLEREQVLNWFGGEEELVEFHQQNQEIDSEAFY